MASTSMQTIEPKERPTVVIIGGGFGGLNAAKTLAPANVDVILVDRSNYHLFQPLLYQVATAGLEPGDIASPIRSVLAGQRNVSVIHGEVEKIDRKNRVVCLTRGRIEYDFLIVAAGMENNYFGRQEWKTFAPGLKTLNDALECRRRILQAFERAEWMEDPEILEALLTFVIVGAGATGVEMAGAIKEIAHDVMRKDFRNIDPRRTRVILVDGGSAILSGYHEELSARAKTDLEEMGIEVRLNELVEEITAEGVQVGAEFIPSHTVIWAAGVKASPLALSLETDLDRMGRVIVQEHLNIEGDERVFVIGDLAHAKDADGEALPGLAPVAIQQGKYTARKIRAYLERGSGFEPFQYKDRGKMATLGKARAVAEIGDSRFGGFGAWLLWLFVHLLFLIGFRNRLFVVLDWFYAYVGSRRGARLIIETPEAALNHLKEWEMPRIEAGRHFLEKPEEKEDQGNQGAEKGGFFDEESHGLA